MNFKKTSGWLHLWLGIASGLVVLIVSLTGAIYEFQPELTKLTQPFLSVQALDKPFRSITDFKQIAEKVMPGKKPNRIAIKGKSDALVGQFFGKKPTPYYYAICNYSAQY